MGDADIKATFPKGGKEGKPRTHEINCSTYAMLILLLFNDLPAGASIALDEIQARTNIPPSDLARNLQSLAVAPKTRFLVKEPMSREINPGDRFSFNENFKSQFVKIKVGVVSAGNKVEGDKERKETEKKNNDSRGFAVEAAVVRIMKYVLFDPRHRFPIHANKNFTGNARSSLTLPCSTRPSPSSRHNSSLTSP
jgi:cullin 3